MTTGQPLVSPSASSDSGLPGSDNNSNPSPVKLFNELLAQIRTWHYDPDIEIIKIILSFIVAYKFHEPDPLWIHIIGPSGSGKTSLGIALLDRLYPDHHPLGDLTSNTLLSGLVKGKEKGKRNSLLHRIGEFGLLYAPDFTNFLGKHPQEISAVAGQLRQVYDGHATKDTGAGDTRNEWFGRISMITAMTPSKESKWLAYNRDGERFEVLRWPKAPATNEMIEMIGSRSGNEDDLREEMRARARSLIDQVTIKASSAGLAARVGQLPSLIAKLRTQPFRPDGYHISHVMDEASPGRMIQQLFKVARGWASLMGRNEANEEDWKLAERLATDSIPETRKWILESMGWGGEIVTPQELLEMTPFYSWEGGLGYQVDDLVALGIMGKIGTGELYLTDSFLEMAWEAMPDWINRTQAEYSFEEKVERAKTNMDKKEFSKV